MEMNGTREMPAASDAVWRALNDPSVLKECITGCESIEPNGTNSYTMTLATKVGPVAARFSGKMRLEEIEPRRSYELHFEGTGGPAGFAKGQGRVTLVPTGPDATRLEYVAKAQVGGKLAQIGSRLIDGAAQRMAEDFFERFVTSVSPTTAEMQSPVAVDTDAASVARRSRRPFYVAVAVVGALVAIALVWRVIA